MMSTSSMLHISPVNYIPTTHSFQMKASKPTGDKKPPAKLKRASSVVLVARRPPHLKSNNHPTAHNPCALRVLMVKRAARTSHMGNLLVFPGGSVDENDFPVKPNHNQGENQKDNTNDDKLIEKQLRLITSGQRSIPDWEGLNNTSPLFHQYTPETLVTAGFLGKPLNERYSMMELSHCYAHRATAIREIFEESGLIGIPHSAKFSTPSKSTTNNIIPSFLPIDLDQHYGNSCQGSDDAGQIAKTNLNAISPLATTLGTSIHETFRRIIHLNDQSILDDIHNEMNPTHVKIGENGEKIALPATFIDYCESIGILTNSSTHTKSTADKTNHLPHQQQAGELSIIDTLIPFAKWISPIVEPKRFDTNFYISLVETDSIQFCPNTASQTHQNATKIDILDDIMCHFSSVAQVSADGSANQLIYQKSDNTQIKKYNSDLEKQQYQLEKLGSSTLAQEISNIEWVSPLDILSQLDTVTMAPPTQYILSQLSGFTSIDEIETFVSDPSTSSHTHSYYQQHIPQCPKRVGMVSFDPYTIKMIQHFDSLPLQTPPQSRPVFTNSYFPSPPSQIYNQTISKLNEGDDKPTNFPHTLNTKGLVLLPQDFMHPLTQQLLSRAIDLLNSGGNHTTTKPSNLSTDGTNDIDNIYQEYSQKGGVVDDQWTNDLDNYQDISNIILSQMAPPIKLSSVDLYQSPIDTMNEYNRLAKDAGMYDNEVIYKFINSSLETQKLIKPLIHFHRIVDGLVHNNWEIVISNPNIIHKTRKELNGNGERMIIGGGDAKM